MKSRAPLVLMEQLVMILVFALAAALCLQVFVLADRVSARNEQTDRAVLACQNTAETLKAAGWERSAALLGGTFSRGVLSVYYDENWAQTEQEESCVWLLQAEELPTDLPGLCQARVRVSPADDAAAPLFELTVAWQEVGADG